MQPEGDSWGQCPASLHFGTVRNKPLLWAKLCPPKKGVEVPTSSTSECDLIWKWGHCRCKRGKMGSYWSGPLRDVSEDRHREHLTKVEAETGVTHPSPGHLWLPEARKQHQRIPSRASE